MYAIHPIRRLRIGDVLVSDTAVHHFWLIQSGAGQVVFTSKADGRSTLFKFTRNDCILAAPGDHVTFESFSVPDESLMLLEIPFDYLEEIPKRVWSDQSNAFPLNERRFACRTAPLPRFGPLPFRENREFAHAASRLAEFAEATAEHQTLLAEKNTAVASETLALSANASAHAALRDVRFQQLIALLAKPIAQTRENPSNRLTDIGRTVEYMRLHYGETLTRDRLAAVAGLSPWYYSAAFRREMGCTPTVYLNELRMRRAREKLILGQQSIPEIADSCGFRDETYFNRRFKASSGATPTAFARRSRDRIADMSYAYVTHLLALDLAPCAAMVDSERESYRRPYHSAIGTHLRRSRIMTPPVWTHNLTLLEHAAPELIVCDDSKEIRAYGGELERIAPCLYIPWKSLDWRGQLRSLAAYTRRESQAEMWLERYEQESRNACSELERLVQGDTVLLLRVTGNLLAVYGRRNVGAVLYGDLKLNGCYDSDEIEVERIVDLEFVLRCDPDLVLLVVDRDQPSGDHWARLQQMPQWQELRAVRNQNVCRVTEMPWLEYSPLAHLWIVRHLPELLTERKNAQSSC